MARSLPLLLLAILLSTSTQAPAQGPPERPPASVVTATIGRGTVAPHAPFVGTVTYPEISEVASEANGRVAEVFFEEGQRVEKGDALVTLDATVLRKEIVALEASRAQAAVEAKKARLEEQRFKALFEQKTISRQEYEDHLYAMQALALRSDSLAAQVAALKEQLAKKTVYAPFAGVVLDRRTERGEWVEPGTVVADLGRDGEIDILVNVPAGILDFATPGLEVGFEAGGERDRGRIEAVIPRGDIRTRTFPVKIRAPNRLGLRDGMDATVHLPSGPRREGFVVPRDAIVTVQGRDTVFTVAEEAAKAIDVEIVGYDGLSAGIAAEGLVEGAPVVTKGNERLQDGQPVQVIGKSE